MVSESMKKATVKYVTEKTDRFEMHFAKGKKDEYKAKAAAKGMSLTAYIVWLIENDK